MQTRFVRAGGIGTSFVEAGEPDRPAVVLVHDGAYGTDSRLCWEGVIDELARDYHVIAPDLIGWGGTDKLCYFDRSPYDYRLQHLAALCDTLGLDEPAFFAGSSFGAELVARGAAEPRWGWSVRAAVAITGTGGRLYRVPGGIERLSDYSPSLDAAARLTAMLVSSAEGMDDHFARRFDNSMIAGHWEALNALHLRNPAAGPRTGSDDWPEPLLGCSVPILWVEGADDPLLERGWAAKMAELGDSFSSLVVPGGHEPNLEHPADVGRMIRTTSPPISPQLGEVQQRHHTVADEAQLVHAVGFVAAHIEHPAVHLLGLQLLKPAGHVGGGAP